MKNFRAMGYGLVALWAYVLSLGAIEKAPVLFGGGRIAEETPTHFVLMISLIFVAGSLSSVCFGFAHGRPTLAQRLLLAPGLYACALGLFLDLIFTGTRASSSMPGVMSAIRSVPYAAGIFLLPSFAGVLAGTTSLRFYRTDTRPGSRTSDLSNSLAAGGIGFICFVGVLFIYTMMSLGAFSLIFIAGTDGKPAMNMFTSVAMGCMLFLVLGAPFVSGIAAHGMFSTRFGIPSLPKRILLSSGLYAFPTIFAADLPETPGHSNSAVSAYFACLLLFCVSFAGVQYAKQRQAKRATAGESDAMAAKE